jgi:hypothetical protein
VFFLASVLESRRYTRHSRWDRERNEAVGVIVLALNRPPQNNIRWNFAGDGVWPSQDKHYEHRKKQLYPLGPTHSHGRAGPRFENRA